MTVVGRWPLAEDRLYIEMYVTFLRKPKPVEKTIGVWAGGARGAAAPPKFGQSQFSKTFPYFYYYCYFEEINIFYFNQKSA